LSGLISGSADVTTVCFCAESTCNPPIAQTPTRVIVQTPPVPNDCVGAGQVDVHSQSWGHVWQQTVFAYTGIQSATPNNGPPTSSTTVLLRGLLMYNTYISQILIGAVPATINTQNGINTESISINVPAQPAGVYPIYIFDAATPTVPYSSMPDAFTYAAIPPPVGSCQLPDVCCPSPEVYCATQFQCTAHADCCPSGALGANACGHGTQWCVANQLCLPSSSFYYTCQ
jgi:hypothetical protein